MKTINQPQTSKAAIRTYIDYILLGVCLSIIALRATFTEGPTVQLASQQFTDTIYSLAISGILIICFLIWVLSRLYTGNFQYRIAGIETGIGLFVIAAFISILFASNKRTAINDFSILFPPILMTILLVQLVDSNSKIKLVLVVIAALGVLSAYQCTEQFFYSNELTIQQYQKDPQGILKTMRIQAGSLQQMMFEHSLYSKDVKGFFVTGNSAGSFAIMAFFAGLALTMENFKNRKHRSFSNFYFLIAAILTSFIFVGLIFTESKGAIGAFAISVVSLLVYASFPRWLGKHKKTLFAAFLLLSFAFVVILIFYGLRHGRLPGGNSMLVRWQYWYASVKMYFAHWLVGVGPGNFPDYYTHYKIPAAIETVSEPHNFLLNILTQYGPLGLAGFLAICLIPLYKTIFNKSNSTEIQEDYLQNSFLKPAVISLVLIIFVFLLIRPLIMPLPSNASSEEIQAGRIIFYIVPLMLFVPVFILFSAGAATNVSLNKEIIQGILFCTLAGVLIHNLVDFAIFEPGIFTTFCAILACLISLNLNKAPCRQIKFSSTSAIKIISLVFSVLIIYGYINSVFTPVAKTTSKIKLAASNRLTAHKILELTAKDDPLSPLALTANAQLYLDEYNNNYSQTSLLTEAANCLEQAISRDRANFKNYEKLSQVYALLAQTSANLETESCLSKALDYAIEAVKCYPGSSELRMQLAELAEQTGKKELALANYEKVIEMEDAYRKQFQIMYPGKPVFNRLDAASYDHAVSKVKSLSAPK